MNPCDQLSLPRLPARLTAEQTAVELGFAVHDIAVLIGAKLLKPLGNPERNSVKYFATVEIRQYGADPKWLGNATAAVQRHWRKNHENRGVRR